MENNDERYIKLEKKFQEELHTQKRFYESEIELLKSKIEYEKNKIKIECESAKTDEINGIKAFYDVKNTQDLATQKSYYLSELESQKNWYEKQIIKKQAETAAWHENHTKEELEALRKAYEEMLAAKDDEINVISEKLNAAEAKYKELEETLSEHIIEQKNYYESQLKPFKKVLKLQKKLQKKFQLPDFSKKTEEKVEVQNKTEQSEIIAKPKVSVILPVYNVGKYLRQSLDSLINQTLKEIEIICVDDGSTDDSYEILEEYKQKDNRIKVIHKENKGTGAARNDGLRLAQGECIGFVDPDDWVKPNMFERLYGLIKEKDLDIAMCMPDGYDERNNVNAPFPYFVDANWENLIDDRIFNWRDLSPFSYPMCVWNKLYTKKLFDENNIDFAEGLDFEDHKVIFGTLLTAEKIFFIREKLYVYRYNREGSVLSDNNRRLIDHMEIFNIVEELMKATNTFNILRNDFLTYKIHNVLYYYSMIKDEFKEEYYQNMVKCIKDTALTDDEYSMLSEKYPELKEICL